MVTHDADRSNAGRARPPARGLRHPVMMAALVALMLTQLAWAQRTELKPGWNMFSPQQDVEMGQQVSRDAEKQVPLLNDSRVDNYLNNLGRTLASHAPGERYPYQYKCVNDRAINAFALPGGFVYINRGVIEAADNEAELAGVMAHETSHVALRHGTNQATKAYIAQVPLAILGGALGNKNSVAAVLTQIGAGFATNSLLLKYSRTAESQADEMGTQILYDSGYDPRAMAQFFQKIQEQDGSGRQVEFFSNHPNPDNRIERVDQEIGQLGNPVRGAKTDSREFQNIKSYVQSLPAPRGQGGTQNLAGNTGSGRGSRYGLQILSAQYGNNTRFTDVRELLQSRVQNDRLSFKVTNAAMGGDPVRGAKTLSLSYGWAGRTYDVTARENQQVSIPTAAQQQQTQTGTSSGTQPEWPSNRSTPFENSVLRINHPDNWQAYGQGEVTFTIAPDRGLVDDGRGNQALAYGLIVNMYEPRFTRNDRQQLQPRGYGQSSQMSLEEATDRLIEDLRLSNQGMRIIRSPENIRVDGQQALSTDLSNESPLGGRETNWLVTVTRPEGVLFFVFVAPDGDFQSYNHAFRIMLDSVRFRQ